jgi:hypothetical protein
MVTMMAYYVASEILDIHILVYKLAFKVILGNSKLGSNSPGTSISP